jgi:hypothetical protein
VYFHTKGKHGMGARESLQKLLDRKQAEITRLEQEIRDAKVYIQGVQDAFRLLPKEDQKPAPQPTLRPGTAMALVESFLKSSGKPQHISAILEAQGKENTKENRVSLSGSLGGYAKDGRIFTRPAPNTFGLIEFNSVASSEDESLEENQELDLPEGFGQ